MKSRQRELWIAALVVVVDQAVKALVRQHLPLDQSIAVIPGFFDLTRVHNTGTAFGFLNGLDFHAFGWHFWAFNVADSAISVGAALTILDGLLSGKAGKRA